MSVFVILPAAGIGTRMASATGGAPKQFIELGGIPILLHSLRAFLAVPRVTGIYIAVREPDQPRVSALLAEHKLSNRVHVVSGGDTRQDSVANALAALPSTDESDIVLVHDAVRPLIDAPTIDRTIDAIQHHGAAIVGTPAIDTIKQVERTADGALITATIPRELIVHAQTPQGATSHSCAARFPKPKPTSSSVPTRPRSSSAPTSPSTSFPGTAATSRSPNPATSKSPNSI